jgi:tetratricopeptide (TPR) repeat protein
VTDFTKAAEWVEGKPLEVEPDGMPNKLNIPVSNTQFNIWYHLGLAYYLLGQHENAASAYQECLKWCKNDDSLTACADWLYMTYRRMGNIEEAVKVLDLIRKDMEIIENQAYHNRLLMYKGLKTPESLLMPGGETEYDRNLAIATQGYGVANWYYYNGDKEKAKEIANQIMEGKSWAAFGYIAAEVDQARNYFEDLRE